ncbi:MAG: Franean1_4349 family RiPP [Planctomycetes bacterium]|nr:Franean1_4349 family RiPP [Planctomycetota bacterium]
MSQRDVERALGRLLTDEQFRRAFTNDPGRACREAGFDLSAFELDALAAVPSRALPRLVAHIDERIRRLELPDPEKEIP